MTGLGSINARQLVFVFMVLVLAKVHMFATATGINISGRDVWIVVILAGVIGALCFGVIYRLAVQFPDKSLAQYSPDIFGSYFGSVVTSMYIVLFLLLSIIAAVEYGQMMSSAFLHEVPEYTYQLLILIPAVYGAYLGAAVTGRMGDIILPLGILLIISLTLLNFRFMDFTNYLPIMDNGVQPVLEGSVVLGSRFTFAVILLALFPLIKDQNKLMGYGLIGIIVLVVNVQMGTMAVALFGANYAATQTFPSLMLLRHTQMWGFERMDSFMMLIWIGGVFLVILAFLYCAALLTKDMLKLKSHRGAAVIYGVVIATIGGLMQTRIIELRDAVGLPLAYGILALTILLPLLMLIIATAKKSTSSK